MAVAPTSKTLTLDDGATSWFSPNTPALRKSGAKNEKRPPDMDDPATPMLGARHAILFLAFYPGSPSLANWAAQAQKGPDAVGQARRMAAALLRRPGQHQGHATAVLAVCAGGDLRSRGAIRPAPRRALRAWPRV